MGRLDLPKPLISNQTVDASRRDKSASVRYRMKIQQDDSHKKCKEKVSGTEMVIEASRNS